MKIAVIGAGAFGTALGGILADKGCDIDYYDSKLERESLKDVLSGASYIVLCVPSSAVPYLLPHLPKKIPMIVATKGLLSNEIFKEFVDWMVISGPGFADDIKSGKDTLLTATDRRVVELFKTNYLKFDFTSDRRGALMCGALKNVYAIGAGLLNLKRNSLKWREYVIAVAEEMREILGSNGAKKATVELACGIGDLELTCGLPSRNFEFGLMLRDNPNAKPEKTVEGVTTLNKIRRGDIIIPANANIMQGLMEERWG